MKVSLYAESNSYAYYNEFNAFPEPHLTLDTPHKKFGPRYISQVVKDRGGQGGHIGSDSQDEKIYAVD